MYTHRIWGIALALGMAAVAAGNAPAVSAADHPISRWITLEQGWDDETRHRFWFTSQGSEILPYEWFLALEQTDSTEPFRSDANMERFRYIPEKADAEYNPDGLPIGFAKTAKRDKNGDHWMGFTCAACHTGQVNYQGTAMLIDGGPTMADFSSFFNAMIAALQQTDQDAAKFQRFAAGVLGAQAGKASKLADLRKKLQRVTADLVERNAVNEPPRPYGYARLDAFGNIFNQVAVAGLGIPENRRPPDAPVSYPFIWDVPQSDRVQWNGAASNRGFGPLGRNTGEVIGVFGKLKIDCVIPRQSRCKPFAKYPSAVDIKGLGKLEGMLTTLWSPQWPERLVGAIDPAKVAQGKVHYQAYCETCHAPINRTDPQRRINAVILPLPAIGTDPKMAMNAASSTSLTGKLQGTREGIVVGDKFGERARTGALLSNSVIGVVVSHLDKSLKATLEDYLYVGKNDPLNEPGYRTRPLNGIWATAPYLHNGSVPNLWELLQAPDRRAKTFYVGSRELDPVNVGYDTTPFPGGFEFDTRLESNSNAGHDYGTNLSDEAKWQLIEYLKTL